MVQFECFLISGSRDISHLRILHEKLCRKFHVRDRCTNEQMNIQTDERTNRKAKTIYSIIIEPAHEIMVLIT